MHIVLGVKRCEGNDGKAHCRKRNTVRFAQPEALAILHLWEMTTGLPFYVFSGRKSEWIALRSIKGLSIRSRTRALFLLETSSRALLTAVAISQTEKSISDLAPKTDLFAFSNLLLCSNDMCDFGMSRHHNYLQEEWGLSFLWPPY